MLTAALAFLLAVLGTIGVLAYVRGANQRAIQGIKAVSVLVARQPIPSGTNANAALRDGKLALERLPASSVPPNALHDLTGRGSLVMSANIQPGELLLQPMLVVASQATGGIAIPNGDMAVTVQLCIPEAVAGNVKAGSYVAVFDTYTKDSAPLTAQPNCPGPHQQQNPHPVLTSLVLKRALVLSIGQQSLGSGPAAATSADSSAAGSATVLVTFAVDQSDAERLIQVAEVGLPYLALLTSSSKTGFGPPAPLIQFPNGIQAPTGQP
jgi:pilus assembly protein CpaB